MRLESLLLGALLCTAPALVTQEFPGQEPAAESKQQPPKQTGKKQAAKKPTGQEQGVKKQGQEKGKDSKKGEEAARKPAPQPADSQDAAAMLGANKLIAAERRLAKMIREGKITGLDKIVTFDELSTWPYEDGLKGMPDKVKKLDGKKVMMIGFMFPIAEVENIKEFLLVGSLWSCHFGQPPDINGLVRVVMPGKKRTDWFFDPLKITGKFKVEATVIDGYCVDVYQLEVETIEAIK